MKIGLIASLNINVASPVMGKPHVPLGLLCLAAVLEPAGYKVEVLDPNLWLLEGQIQPIRGFEDEIARRIAAGGFDVVGFSTMVNTYHLTLRVATALKNLDPKVTIVLGGPQATHTDVATLKAFRAVDIIARGEGEMIVLDLLSALETKSSIRDVAGITYRQGDQIIKNDDAPLIANVNELPFPAYHFYPIRGRVGVPVDAGRGCPYHCNFCSTSIFWRRRFRQKDPERIAEEMKVLKDGYQVQSVDFTHDLFTLERNRALEFCRTIRRRRLVMPWTCSTRVDTVDKDLLKMMAKAGCTAIFYGVESGSDDMQHVIGKGFDVSIVRQKIKDTVSSKIKAIASFIVGFPEEKEEDVKKTIDLAMDLLGLSPLVETVQIHLLAVTSETKLWNQYKGQLQYDGIETDQVSGTLYIEEDPWIKEHPELFAGHYFLPTPHVERDFLIDLHILGMAANRMLRWSLVAASKKAGAFAFAKRWHAWSKENKVDISSFLDFSFPKEFTLKNTQMHLFAERLASLARYLKHDPENIGWKDEVFDTLINHETTMMQINNSFILDLTKRSRTKMGDVLEKKKFLYDPRSIILKLTKGFHEKPRPAKTIIEYRYAGWSATGPVIKFQKARKPKKAKRVSKTKKRRKKNEAIRKRRRTRRHR